MMEHINREKCYKLLPKRQMDISHVVLPTDWLRCLIVLCSPSTHAEFEKHIGKYSRYASKNILIDTLKFHYAVLSDRLTEAGDFFVLSADQKNAIISKLNEEITLCTPGFHVRVNSLLESYFLPKTIDELLSTYRHEIVERAAHEATDDVHTNNRFFIVASISGFGVYPKLVEDKNLGNIEDYIIRQRIQKAFVTEFQPFSFISYLKSMMLLYFDKYAGRNDSAIGYPIETYEPGLDFLKNLFGEPSRNYDYLILNDKTAAVCDINWGLIYNKLWTLLIQKKYFLFRDLSVKAPFYDLANEGFLPMNKIAALFSSEKECFAYLDCNPLLPNKLICSLLFHTLDTFNQTPSVEAHIWTYVSEHPQWADEFAKQFFLKYAHKHRQFENTFLNHPNTLNDLIEITPPKALKSLFLKLHHLSTPVLLAALLYKNKGGDGVFLCALKASKGNYAFIRDLLSIINTLPVFEDKKSILQFDSEASKNGLLYTLEYCPAAVPLILRFVLTMESVEQNKWINVCLSSKRCHTPQSACIQFLLKLNQKVNAIQQHAQQRMAYIAADLLQNQLIAALATYFDNQGDASAYMTLCHTWRSAFVEAYRQLANHVDWGTIFANAALVLVSIPLLGLPLILNYYRSGYTHTFFHTQEWHELHAMAEVVQNEVDFARMWSVSESS